MKAINKAIFLDRDGILNEVIIRDGIISSPWSIDEFKIISGAKVLVELLKSKGYLLFVVSNQPDVERGKLSLSELAKMNRIINKEFLIDKIEYCTSSDNNHYKRKPNPGMIIDLAQSYNVFLMGSFLIGDSEKDILAGRAAGLKTILLQKEYNKKAHGIADFNCDNYSQIIKECFNN